MAVSGPVLRVSHRGRLAGMSSACWPLMDVHVELIDNGALIHAPSRLIPCWSCCGRPWWGTAVAKAHGTRTSVSYTHLRAHETDSYLVCRLLLEKKKNKTTTTEKKR